MYEDHMTEKIKEAETDLVVTLRFPTVKFLSTHRYSFSCSKQRVILSKKKAKIVWNR